MDDDRLDDSLRLAVMRLARRMRLERGINDLRDHQLSVLFTLLREGAMSVGKLGEVERISAPSITRTVNVMVKSGYLKRSGDKDDGRVVVVEMTEAGRAAALEARRRRAMWFSEALRGLTEVERRSLHSASEILQRLANS